MAFNSSIFFFCFFIVCIFYYLLSHKKQNYLLLAFSYLAYGYFDYRFLILFLISTTIDFWAAIKIENSADRTQKKFWLLSSISLNLIILGFFKYMNFFIDSLYFFGISIEKKPEIIKLILPLGISFYTFQAIAYVVDVYREQIKAVKNYFTFSLFLSFFPQLVAGPIERADKLIPQLENKRSITINHFKIGTWLILWGLFKKIFVADNLASYTHWSLGAEKIGAQSFLDAWLSAFAFAIRLYCDFSGYSDMARGLSMYLGIEISKNFKFPYFAQDPYEFWQRWHITLGSWFRDYFYYPLRKLFKNKKYSHLILCLTFVTIGLWHGPHIKFILWGLVWFLGMILYSSFIVKIFSYIKIKTIRRLFLHLYIVIIAFTAGVFFISFNFENALFTLKKMWSIDSSLYSARTWIDFKTVSYFSFLLICVDFFSFYKNEEEYFPKLLNGKCIVLFYILLIALLLTSSVSGTQEFIYFQF